MFDVFQELANFQVHIAIIIFLLTYALIITEKMNRAITALLGAVLMIIFGIINQENALRHIEWGTIGLLMGMMIIVGITQQTGLFSYIAIKAAKLVNGEPLYILISLATLTAVFSALLDNVTTVLLIVPVTLSITRVLKIDPIPFLMTEIIASNIGGTATLIGDPPNIMIGPAANLDFNAFLVNLGPISLMIYLVVITCICFIYRKQLRISTADKMQIHKINEKLYLQNIPLLIKSVVVLLLTIIGFVFHHSLGLEAATIAMAGAVLLMCIGLGEKEIHDAFQKIEWVTIFFFVGLFILVGALVEIGLIKQLALYAIDLTKGDVVFTSILLIWMSGIFSAIIDNIPFVATMIPLIQTIGSLGGISDLEPLWWSLALGACLGGNGSLIGASANVIVAGMALKDGKEITYLGFLKLGAPLTLLSLVMATIYVYLMFLT
ncbi:hypothetical protein BHU72_08635 [Desulfuribacillus stibiiarsenatis]|uniref:Citrate transporter-like domain-containing protein n=1 Tax=Desulfuribacillus stibiiarsenatis TaxID=1390249 RepID=A0A1E5L3A3_9FIRM|nr:ArsB/NhaD family transporter [Desulfuribacillus stibiiarsenatis]OEH84564.1 hypothetical protein BHU72_08635 [Desulfuribacillus stibiiarsenatis]